MRLGRNLFGKFLPPILLVLCFSFAFPLEAAQIKAVDFQLFKQDGKTRGRVTLVGDCLGGVPESDYIAVLAYQVLPGGTPPLLKECYHCYTCPCDTSLVDGYGNCISDEQLHGRLCNSFTLWDVVHRSNMPWTDPACSGYTCEETAPFNYVAEFDIPDSLLTGCGRTIFCAYLSHTWGGPNAYWPATVHLYDRFYDNGGLLDSIGDVFVEADYQCKALLCKLSQLKVSKDIYFEQLTDKRKPFANLRLMVNCGEGNVIRTTDANGHLHLEIGPCGCTLTVCDPRVIKEYMYKIQPDGSSPRFAIPNDEEIARYLERVATTKFFEASNSVIDVGSGDSKPMQISTDLHTPIQKFYTNMAFHNSYHAKAEEMRKQLLRKRLDCGGSDAQGRQAVPGDSLLQAEQIFGAFNTTHKQVAIGGMVAKDPAAAEAQDLTVLANDDDLLVLAMQGKVVVKLSASKVDVYGAAIFVRREDSAYDINLLSGYAIVYNHDGVPFSPAIGSGTWGRVAVNGDLVSIATGLSPLPDFDRNMKVVSEDGEERLNGIEDALRLFGNFRQTVVLGKGQITYDDRGYLDLSGSAEDMRPISFSYDGARLQLEVATPIFADPVDLYLGVMAEPYDKFTVLNYQGRWSNSLSPWKKNVKVVPFEVVIPAFPAAGLRSGKYRAYLFAVPAGTADFSSMTGWEAVFDIPAHREPSEDLDESLIWRPSDGIKLLSGGSSSSGSEARSCTLISPDDPDSVDNCAYSFVKHALVNPNEEGFDVCLEPWCVDGPALCGKIIDLGAVDLAAVNVNNIPTTGYQDDCREVDPAHTFVSENQDGSHTAFCITRHAKLDNCKHTVDISYRNLD